VNGMATESSYTIAPLSPETWSAFDALVQRHNGIFGAVGASGSTLTGPGAARARRPTER